MSSFNVITRSQLCRELNCHRDSIKRWVKECGFPEPLPGPMREPIFDRDAVQAWIRGNEHSVLEGGSK